jgi:hypothetical protein
MQRFLGHSAKLEWVAATAICALASAGIAAATAGAAAHTSKLLVSDSGPFKVKPANVYYANGHAVLGGKGADPPGSFGTFHWNSWSSRKATGSGTAWTNDCKPDCGEGTFVSTAATATASAAKGGHFTALTIRTDGKTVKLRLSGSDSSAFWAG